MTEVTQEDLDKLSTRINELTAEASKYHKRAQTAEQVNSDREAELETAKTAKLIEDGKLKELNESLTSDLDKYKSDIEGYKGKAELYDADQVSQRDALIAKLPEDERDELKDLPLLALKAVVKRIETKPPPKIDEQGRPLTRGEEDWRAKYPTKGDLIKRNRPLYDKLKAEGKI